MKLLLDIILLFLLFYLVLCLFMYFRQEHFLFYPPQTRHEVQADDLIFFNLERDKGVTLRGWLLNPDAAHRRLLIYYGGNGEDIYLRIEQFREYPDTAVLLINYRGYGISEGKPGEQALYSDALSIFDTIITTHSPQRVFLLGRSLGSAIATYVGAQRKVDGIILVTPFTSLQNLARTLYPYLPISLLLRHKFLSETNARKITAPCLVIYGGKDTTVPPTDTRKLIDALGERVTTVFLPEAQHNNIDLYERYQLAILDFIR